MSTTYGWLADLAQSAGIVYFLVLFGAVLVYAFWPKNAKRFEEASRMPLRED